jgi:hypothetical protein
MNAPPVQRQSSAEKPCFLCDDLNQTDTPPNTARANPARAYGLAALRANNVAKCPKQKHAVKFCVSRRHLPRSTGGEFLHKNTIADRWHDLCVDMFKLGQRPQSPGGRSGGTKT